MHPSAWKGDSPKLVSAILNILVQEEGGAMLLLGVALAALFHQLAAPEVAYEH
jgi:hypothetical protein